MMKDYKSKVSDISKKDENLRCIDCNAMYPKWVSIYYGTFMCLECAGVHRSLGIYLDSIKSVGLDVWEVNAYLSVKYGGNKQFLDYLSKYGNTEKNIENKYRQEKVIKYSQDLARRIKEETGVEIKYANMDSIQHKIKKPDVNTGNNRISNGISLVKNSYGEEGGFRHKTPEWASSLNTIKDKTIEYSAKIGARVYKHAKSFVSTSSELIANKFKNKKEEKSYKHTEYRSFDYDKSDRSNKIDWT